jgi:transcriptional regulator with XRE-family HTH domain
VTGKHLRNLRQQAGLAGYMVCRRSGIGRSRLSDLERGYAEPNESEIDRIENAIKELVEARERVVELAVRVGWPM